MEEALDRRSILHRWFVQYNPCYFASALSILGGVFLLARELPPDSFGSKLGVAASTEVYQVLLMAGAAVLLRAGLKRPAAILGITAFIFILDVAMNGERLMSFMGVMSLKSGMRARRAIPASVVFALLGPVKLWLLARIFRLRSARGALAVAGSVVAALPLLPYAVELESTAISVRNSIYLVISWAGAPVLGWAFLPSARRWTSGWTEEEPDPWLTRRIVLVSPFLVVGLFAAHVVGWSSLSELSLTPALAAPYLLAAACAIAARYASGAPRASEFLGWAGAGATLLAAACAPSETGLWPLATLAIATGAALVVLLEKTGLRLFLPATVCLFGGAYMIAAGNTTPLARPGPLWPGAIALALLAGAVRQRDFRCLFVSALAAGATVVLLRPALVPLPYGALVAGIWLAVTSWVFFPGLRRWVPFAATVLVLALAGWMSWEGLAGSTVGCGTLAASAIGIGVALRRVEFQGAGFASGAVLAALKYESWVPQSAGGWGLALVLAGFLLLAAGVAINLMLARGPALGRLVVRGLGTAGAPDAGAAEGERADDVG
jgi:hypothetical protein